MRILIKRLLVMGFGIAMLLSCNAHVEPEIRNDISAGNIKAMGSGFIQHSYERSERIKFDFIKRQKPFTVGEIKAIEQALDKLPDAFLAKVIFSGVAILVEMTKALNMSNVVNYEY